MNNATQVSAITKRSSPSAAKAGATDGLMAQLAYLTPVMNAPTVAARWEQLAERARAANWSHEEYLPALLSRRVADREAHGNHDERPHRAPPATAYRSAAER